MKKNEELIIRLPPERIAQSKIVIVVNNKGGVGKTSTATALGMIKARSGGSVLFWDNDPQSNLSQRLGMSDDLIEGHRLNSLFMNYREEPDRKLIKMLHYSSLKRMNNSIVRPGHIGLMPGSHEAEMDAENTFNKFSQKTYTTASNTNIFNWFKTNIDFYKQYFDLIIMDTAPAIEGNKLNTLACSVADEIIIPIDSIDAALGMRTLLSWIRTQVEQHNLKIPQVTLAVVKYQNDLSVKDSNGVRNKVYRILKDVFGDFVCDNAVRENPKERKKVAGFTGSKTEYFSLSNELLFRFKSTDRKVIFEILRSETFDLLDGKLLKLQEDIQSKEIRIKTPVFESLAEPEHIQTSIGSPVFTEQPAPEHAE